MTMNNHNNEFDRMVYQEFPQNSQTEYTDPHPYGAPAHPVKPGLTKRGKAGMAVVTAVIAGGSIIGWTHYSAQQDAAANKAQELAIKQQELRLKELEILGQQATQNTKTQTSLEAARQKQIDDCVAANKDLVGKQLGATYRSVVDDCKAQYETSGNTGEDLLAAASAANSNGGGGGVNDFVMVGIGVLGLVAAGAARKVTRNTQP
jgi:uncharacterized protein HemX